MKKQRGKKLASKLRLNMSFSELIQRIIERDANGAQEKLDKPKRKTTKAKISQAPNAIGTEISWRRWCFDRWLGVVICRELRERCIWSAKASQRLQNTVTGKPQRIERTGQKSGTRLNRFHTFCNRINILEKMAMATQLVSSRAINICGS